jgi:hypothetical protein
MQLSMIVRIITGRKSGGLCGGLLRLLTQLMLQDMPNLFGFLMHSHIMQGSCAEAISVGLIKKPN